MMKFIATEELGKLSKWLRILGFDTVYFPGPKRELVLESLRDARIILTRDSRMARYTGLRLVKIKSDHVEKQLEQVIGELELPVDSKRLFTRCVVCNRPLLKLKKEKAQGKVPPYVYKTHKVFMRCRECGRTYWQGTHWTNVGEFLKKIDTQLKTLT